jgi:hypothetical protein
VSAVWHYRQNHWPWQQCSRHIIAAAVALSAA